MKKNLLSLVSIVSITFGAGCGSAKPSSASASASPTNGSAVEASCPTALLKGFAGTFKGVMAAVTFQGDSQPLQNLKESHTITSCTSFDFDVHYSNPQTGVETREVKFSAQWDAAKSVFTLSGPIIQGQFRVIREGQFVASFETNFAGNPAHCEEMMTVVNKDQQLMRSVQCASGSPDGASMGVRNALVSR